MNEIIIVSFPGSTPEYRPWMYIGSHNLTAAAWGIFQKKETQLHMRSFEIGVFYPPVKMSELANHGIKDRTDVLPNDTFPVPFMVPPPAYTETDRPYFRGL